jgi:hypothetical protein
MVQRPSLTYLFLNPDWPPSVIPSKIHGGEQIRPEMHADRVLSMLSSLLSGQM